MIAKNVVVFLHLTAPTCCVILISANIPRALLVNGTTGGIPNWIRYFDRYYDAADRLTPPVV